MGSDAVDYKVHGAELQFVEVQLDPAESVVAEAGALLYMEQGIQMSTSLSDGSEKNSGLLGSVIGIGKRALAGESLFMTFFTNKGQGKLKVAFSASFPGKIVPLNLKQLGGTVLCQKGAFLCAAKGVSINVGITKRISSGLFGGEGFILQKLEGSGMAFVHSGGTITEKILSAGESLYVDTGSLVALQPSVDFDIKLVNGIQSMFFSGEGVFLTKLTGPGKIWIQSLPFSRLVGMIESKLPKPKNK